VVDRTPTFIVQPADFYYVTRSKPTTITCRAVDAVQINFKCVGQWVSPTLHDTADGIETAPTRRRYIQVGRTLRAQFTSQTLRLFYCSKVK